MTKRQFAGILTLIIVCLAAGVLAGTRIAAAKSRDGGIEQAPPTAPNYQGPLAGKWEYRFVFVSYQWPPWDKYMKKLASKLGAEGVEVVSRGHGMQEAANRLGAEGFEMVTFTKDKDGWLTYAFRRRL